MNLDLIYPVNFIGNDEWIKSGYQLNLAAGDVITRDGEVVGRWRVVDYDPEELDSGGCYEFIPNGQSEVLISEGFACLDFRMHRGFALSTITREIRRWYELQGGTIG